MSKKPEIIPITGLMSKINWGNIYKVEAEFSENGAEFIEKPKNMQFPKSIEETDLAKVFDDPKSGGVVLKVRKNAFSEDWRSLVIGNYGDFIEVLGFSKAGTLFIKSSVNCNTVKLIEINFETGEELKTIFYDERADALHVLFSEDRNVLAVSSSYFKYKWTVIDDSAKDDFQVLDEIGEGEIFIEDVDLKENKWIVKFHSDTSPDKFYIYDRNRKKAEFQFMSHQELASYEFAPMESVTIKSRDGLDFVSYLTIPLFSEAKNLPMVLAVHGGPQGRDRWGFEEQTQFFANRGYAVLQVNFRGSTGFGKSYTLAADGEWGGKMQDDLTDAVTWAIEKGIADPDKIAIYGGSYGGYAAVAGLTFTPDLFCCGVCLAGVFDLKRDTEFQIRQKNYPEGNVVLLKNLGPVLTDEEFNRKCSPMFHVEKIKAPLLYIHGDEDPFCNIEESDRLAKELAKHGKKFEYVIYKGEPHGLYREDNCHDFFGKVEKFFMEHLGGRTQD